jgi:hypothetical protein
VTGDVAGVVLGLGASGDLLAGVPDEVGSAVVLGELAPDVVVGEAAAPRDVVGLFRSSRSFRGRRRPGSSRGC